MISVFASIGAWLARRIAALGLGAITSVGLLGPLGPIVTGIANAIGATITAIFEIIVSLSRSAEGRVVLGLITAGLGFLYLRFHYIEEGKAMVRPQVIQKMVHAPCARRK